jgi:hypothetical protein
MEMTFQVPEEWKDLEVADIIRNYRYFNIHIENWSEKHTIIWSHSLEYSVGNCITNE